MDGDPARIPRRLPAAAGDAAREAARRHRHEAAAPRVAAAHRGSARPRARRRAGPLQRRRHHPHRRRPARRRRVAGRPHARARRHQGRQDGPRHPALPDVPPGEDRSSTPSTPPAPPATRWSPSSWPTAPCPCTSCRSTDATCLVVGHEDRGCAPATLDACDAVAFLPLLGKVGSLNVATAAVHRLLRGAPAGLGSLRGLPPSTPRLNRRSARQASVLYRARHGRADRAHPPRRRAPEPPPSSSTSACSDHSPTRSNAGMGRDHRCRERPRGLLVGGRAGRARPALPHRPHRARAARCPPRASPRSPCSPTHRRQGHLTRLMRAQLDAFVEERRARRPPGGGRVADLRAVRIRTGHRRLRGSRSTPPPPASAHPASGTIELVTPAALRPHLEAAHEARRAPHARCDPPRGTRCGTTSPAPAAGRTATFDAGSLRGAVWRDDAGTVAGRGRLHGRRGLDRQPPRRAGRGRPARRCHAGGRARALAPPLRDRLGAARSAPATAASTTRCRCSSTTVALRSPSSTTSTASGPASSTCPRTLGQRRAALPGTVVVEVTDDLGFADGTWHLDLAPDGAEVTATTATAGRHAARWRASAPSTWAAARLGASTRRVGSTRPPRVASIASTRSSAPPSAPWSPTTY